MKLRQVVIALCATAILCSCSTKRTPLTYFTDIDTASEATFAPDSYMPKIEADDELYILVSSESPQATAAYNLPLSNPAKNNGLLQVSSPSQLTYIVDSKGYINMPILGRIHVGGMTTEQLAKTIETKIAADVEDPLVVVKLVNFKIDVAGEVKNPGPVNVPTERFSVLDALTAAGDLTEYGERSNVLVIREENGKRTAHRINLNSADALNSPYFFLKQNDYVYVEPNQIRSDNSKYNQNNAYKVTVISTIVSAASVIASLVIALTVK